LGDLADDLFLASLRPVPRKLLQAGYSFQDPDIEQTFRWMIEEMDRGGPAMAHMPRPTRGWR
jgi:NAD dependent epimerase/dehydratase family enzyme